MKDDFYGKKQPFRSPWWLIGAAVLLIAVAAALLWPSESLAPAQEEQTQSAAADQAARLEDVISLKLHPRQSATRRRASASASAACWPTVCRLEGFP